MPSSLRPIRTALISVSDKTGLVELAEKLVALGITLLSTGGSAKLLKTHGLPVTDVSHYTGFPEIMDGRVKTLHPLIHGGILSCLDLPAHQAAMKEHGITPIDLVIVNLYPFADTVTKGASFEECIEQIDVGGPTMIRAAAKNHHYVTVITHPADYTPLLAQLEAHDGSTVLQFRTKMAVKAFAHTASYDAMIAHWFTASQASQHPSEHYFPENLVISGVRKNLLRYGENPHQEAALYHLPGTKEGITNAHIHQGKELSYNNINDANAAIELVSEFPEPAAAIIKHANPCGVSLGKTLSEAYCQAFACDPKSAFGGVIALNRKVEADVAEQILQNFSEVVIAPAVSEEALALFAKKPNIRLLTLPMFDPYAPTQMVTSIRGGFLLQMRDAISGYQHEMHCVTEAKPTDAMLEELRFAFAVCKHVKSNAIVVSARYQVLGTGAGQMSRVDAVRIACEKYQERSAVLGLQEVTAVMASDAFFPFADGIELAAASGIKAVVQPSGSVRDQAVIDRANELGLVIMHTSIRHFKH